MLHVALSVWQSSSRSVYHSITVNVLIFGHINFRTKLIFGHLIFGQKTSVRKLSFPKINISWIYTYITHLNGRTQTLKQIFCQVFSILAGSRYSRMNDEMGLYSEAKMGKWKNPLKMGETRRDIYAL